jgi:hypothetical protein
MDTVNHKWLPALRYCMTGAEPKVELRAIATDLDWLKQRAQAIDMPSIAFLIDIALSEAREELGTSGRAHTNATANSYGKRRQGLPSASVVQRADAPAAPVRPRRRGRLSTR